MTETEQQEMELLGFIQKTCPERHGEIMARADRLFEVITEGLRNSKTEEEKTLEISVITAAAMRVNSLMESLS